MQILTTNTWLNTMIIKAVAVFCSSSDSIHAEYFATAQQLGAALAQNSMQLIYGGGKVGLMGAVAKSVQANNGTTCGVTPKALNIENVVNDTDDELIITTDMRERKAVMDEKADAFIGLPGGFGTFEEMFEILTLKQLSYHNKPIVFLNIRGYYDRLFEMFEHIYKENFAKEQYKVLYHISQSVEDTIHYLKSYQPHTLPDKWFV